MKPQIYLKSFLAVLLILIVAGSLLVAHFRNFSPGAEGHQHGDTGTDGDGHAAAQSQQQDDHAAAAAAVTADQPLPSDAESSHHEH
jgi:hypothetical protein